MVLRGTFDAFRDRAEAGRRLGTRLCELDLPGTPIVLGLPRGGVVVAAEVAAALDGQLDVLVARKLAHPEQPELALGALAEGGSPVWDEAMLRRMGLHSIDLNAVVAAERQELARRVATYRPDRPAPDVHGRVVVLVDDGVATGATARAALRALGNRGAERLLLAVPVAAPESLPTFTDADEVVTLLAPANFVAVGRWYDDFSQLSDEDVRRALDLASSGDFGKPKWPGDLPNSPLGGDLAVDGAGEAGWTESGLGAVVDDGDDRSAT